MWRWIWYIGLAVIACIATVAQIDRHAHEVPRLAHWVPERLRDFALIRQVAAEAAEGLPDRAVTDARRVIAHHPIPAENLTILAVAEHRVGNEARSTAALTLAAQRGWREPLAQQAVALAAAQSGEGEIAADRLSALWRINVGKSFVRDFTVQLLDLPDVRNHFAGKLANKNKWVPPFLDWAMSNLSPTVFTDLIEEANKKNVKFDCNVLNKATRIILQKGELALAQKLWENQCRGLSYGFAFSNVASSIDETQDPFSWVFPPSVGLRVRGAHDGIDFENSDPIRRIVAKKYMALSPGVHNIAVISDGKKSLPRLMFVRIECLGNSNGNDMEPINFEFSNGSRSLEIPNNGCEVQKFSLIVNQGRGKNVRVIVDPSSNSR